MNAVTFIKWLEDNHNIKLMHEQLYGWGNGDTKYSDVDEKSLNAFINLFLENRK